MQVQLIYPATEKHIAKYTSQEMFFVHETPQDWQTITTKYIEQSAFDIQVEHNQNNTFTKIKLISNNLVLFLIV